MGQNIIINGVGHSHVSFTWKITPRFGRNLGVPLRIHAVKSIEYSNNMKQASIPGAQPGPVQLAVGKAEPNWKAEISKAEAQRLINHLGPGYLTHEFDQVFTWQLPGQKATRDEILGCLLEDDGTKSQVGDATMVSIGGLATVVRPNGVHPFADS